MKSIVALAALLLVGVASADTLYITEYAQSPTVTYQAVSNPSLGNQTVAIGAASAVSVATKPQTRIVRLHCDVACHIEIGGAAPVATLASPRMVAGQTEYFVVTSGAKIAVIADPTP